MTENSQHPNVADRTPDFLKDSRLSVDEGGFEEDNDDAVIVGFVKATSQHVGRWQLWTALVLLFYADVLALVAIISDEWIVVYTQISNPSCRQCTSFQSVANKDSVEWNLLIVALFVGVVAYILMLIRTTLHDEQVHCQSSMQHLFTFAHKSSIIKRLSIYVKYLVIVFTTIMAVLAQIAFNVYINAHSSALQSNDELMFGIAHSYAQSAAGYAYMSILLLLWHEVEEWFVRQQIRKDYQRAADVSAALDERWSRKDELSYIQQRFVLSTNAFFFALYVGGCILSSIEVGWANSDTTLYILSAWCTLGYGEYVPATVGGRIFMFAYWPLGFFLISTTSAILWKVILVRGDKKLRQAARWMGKRIIHQLRDETMRLQQGERTSVFVSLDPDDAFHNALDPVHTPRLQPQLSPDDDNSLNSPHRRNKSVELNSSVNHHQHQQIRHHHSHHRHHQRPSSASTSTNTSSDRRYHDAIRLFMAICFVLFWILFSATIFTFTEELDYWQSFWSVFNLLTTISAGAFTTPFTVASAHYFVWFQLVGVGSLAYIFALLSKISMQSMEQSILKSDKNNSSPSSSLYVSHVTDDISISGTDALALFKYAQVFDDQLIQLMAAAQSQSKPREAESNQTTATTTSPSADTSPLESKSGSNTFTSKHTPISLSEPSPSSASSTDVCLTINVATANQLHSSFRAFENTLQRTMRQVVDEEHERSMSSRSISPNGRYSTIFHTRSKSHRQLLAAMMEAMAQDTPDESEEAFDWSEEILINQSDRDQTMETSNEDELRQHHLYLTDSDDDDGGLNSTGGSFISDNSNT